VIRRISSIKGVLSVHALTREVSLPLGGGPGRGSAS
jgi:hypothetical protein